MHLGATNEKPDFNSSTCELLHASAYMYRREQALFTAKPRIHRLTQHLSNSSKTLPLVPSTHRHLIVLPCTTVNISISIGNALKPPPSRYTQIKSHKEAQPPPTKLSSSSAPTYSASPSLIAPTWPIPARISSGF